MAKIYSQLEKAQLENTTSDAATMPKGMITYRTDLNQAKVSNGTVYKFLIDEDSTQTLTGKTLVSPTVTGAITGNQIATPATPSAGTNKLYFKSDNNLYMLSTGGTETQVNGGGGGATTQAYELSNLGLSATISSGSVVLALKQGDGTTDPASGAGAVKIGMRSTTGTTGGYNQRTVATALSFTLSGKAALGTYIMAGSFDLWAYAIDSDGAGTVKLGLSTFKYDDNVLQTAVQASQTFTVTVASPAVFTATGHGLRNNDRIQLSTTGALPTGLTGATGNYYFVKSVTANTFEVSATPEGTSINTTGTQSGTHTLHIDHIRLVSDALYSSKPVRCIGKVRVTRTADITQTWDTIVSSSAPALSEEATPISGKWRGDGISGTSIANATDSAVIFDQPIDFSSTTNLDPHHLNIAYSLAAVNKIVVPVGGLYEVGAMVNNDGGVSWTAGSVLMVRLFKLDNTFIGSLAIEERQATGTTRMGAAGSNQFRFTDNQAFQIMIYQNSGATQTFTGTQDSGNIDQVAWIRRVGN